MTALDALILLIYFGIVLGLGFFFRKRAARNLDSYFLGGRRLPWWALAMSGSVSNFDITGTMWIVSIMFILGMRSMWHHWMWGFLMGAFFLAYMGKWVRRSGVMTAAEWMKTRFGEDKGGKTARTAYALMAILTQASFLGYAFQGIGKFAAVYIPLETWARQIPWPGLQNLIIQHEASVLALSIISITTLYVILGGLFSVVVTDVIQTIVLSLSGLLIAGIAWANITQDKLASLPEKFTSLQVPWRLPEMAGTDNAVFEFFGALVIVWIIKGFLLNAGGPAQMYDFQRFLAARNDRDAAKIGAAWSVFLVVRWAMVMGIVLLALTGITGVSDSEKVMPLVLRDFLPSGIRGLVLAGLLAAFMSTFSSTVNSGASFIVRDIWQAFSRRQPSQSSAIRVSYLATIGLVLLGLLIGLQSSSIADIWNWMMMALGAGIIVPNVLRWYWWRLNGWGYAFGTLGGILLSLSVLFYKNIPDYYLFPLIAAASTILCIVGTLLTRPVKLEVLQTFYTTVKPFGAWRPVKESVHLHADSPKKEATGSILLNVGLGMLAIISLYLAPMYLVGHWYFRAGIWICLGAASVTALKFTWYNRL